MIEPRSSVIAAAWTSASASALPGLLAYPMTAIPRERSQHRGGSQTSPPKAATSADAVLPADSSMHWA